MSRATHSGAAAQGPSAVQASTASKCALSRITLAKEQTCVYILIYTGTVPCGKYVCPFVNVAVLLLRFYLFFIYF